MGNPDLLLATPITEQPISPKIPEPVSVVERDAEDLVGEVNTVVSELTTVAEGQLNQPSDEFTGEVQSLVDDAVTLTQDASIAITELKKAINPRAISKEHDSTGRTTLAIQLGSDKVKKDQLSNEIASASNTEAELQAEINSSWSTHHQLKGEVRERADSIPGKLLAVLHLPDKKLQQLDATIQEKEATRTAQMSENYRLQEQRANAEAQLEQVPNAKDLLQAYYEKVANTPLSNAEKRELLRPEALAQLSTPEYIQLWKRLNPYFLSHVTRQGFRDHNAMMYHSSGLQEYHNGFLGIMEDDALIRPPLALSELKSRDEEGVRQWLGDWVFQGDEEEALTRLNKLMNVHLASAPKYPDKTAVHFMAEVVGDDYYGGESGNEVFFIFPSDVIASQHAFAFNGWEKDLTKPQSERKWNDVFIWPENLENPGIQVDAGLVFLPQTTLVDPETGSKYASQIIVGEDGKQKRVLVEDQAVISNYVTYFREVTSNQEHEISQAVQAYKAEPNYYRKRDLEISVAELISERLAQIGVPSDSSFALARSMMQHMYSSSYGQVDDDQLSAAVRESNAHYKRAENPIPAKQYWETFFKQHPESSPKHVVFYDGNPTQAVDSFLRDNGIGQANTATTEGKLLGFDDHHVDDMDTDLRANNGKAELQAMAERIISEHYKQK